MKTIKAIVIITLIIIGAQHNKVSAQQASQDTLNFLLSSVSGDTIEALTLKNGVQKMSIYIEERQGMPSYAYLTLEGNPMFLTERSERTSLTVLNPFQSILKIGDSECLVMYDVSFGAWFPQVLLQNGVKTNFKYYYGPQKNMQALKQVKS